MRYVALPHGIPDASVLGMGCAAMMGSASRRDSLAALHAATDAGINFFDTARSYGYGHSEALLGEFLTGQRDRMVVCTKFGILPAAAGWKQRVKPLARAALKLFPGLRGAARKQTGQMFSGGHFTPEALRTSLETSLRALRTDYVDLLLMHAAPMSVLAQHDLLAELEGLVTAGKVRMAGISAELEVMAAVFAECPPVLQTVQFAVNVQTLGFLETARPAGMFVVGNHPFGGPLGVAETRRRIAGLRNDETLAAELRAKLDPADPLLLPDVLLNAVLTGTDAVIPAMLKPTHLRANCRAVTQSRFAPAEMKQLRVALTASRDA